MDAKYFQPRSKGLLGIVRVICLLSSVSALLSVAAYEVCGQGLKVTIKTTQAIDNADTNVKPLGGISGQIGPYSFTTGGDGTASMTVAPGRYIAKASMPCPGGQIIFGSVYQGPTGTSPQAGVEVFFDPQWNDWVLEFRMFTYDKSDCSKVTYSSTESFYIVVQTPNCKDPNYKDLIIRIGDKEVTNFKVSRSDYDELIASGQRAELKPGDYEVRVGGSGHFRTEIIKVEVESVLRSYGTFYPKGASAAVKVTLDKQIWEHPNESPALKIKLSGNCPDPDFFSLKILAVTGKVEIIYPDGSTGQPRANGEIIETKSMPTVIRTDAGGSLILESKFGHLITIAESTEVQTKLITTARGREKLEAFIQMGKIQIKRLKPEPGNDSDDTASLNVKTPTATITNTQTIYTVRHDAEANLTSVEVEEGQVEVAPVNTSLPPVTLAANQQVQVAANNVSPVTAFTPGKGSSNTGKILLYVGLSLLALLVLAAMFLFFRRQHRLAMRPAYDPAGPRNTGWNTPPVNVAFPVVDTASPKCPNPQCGKTAIAGEKTCAHCGAGLNG